MKEKLTFLKKGFLGSLSWSIAAQILFNAVIQFLVYPILAGIVGSEEYGNILYLISIVNIFAIPVGVGCNYARMSESAIRKTMNGDYHSFVLICCLFYLPILEILRWMQIIQIENGSFILFFTLLSITTWRYYADVDFRLNINYKNYFFYYLFISLGYCCGIVLIKIFNNWILMLIAGEIFGLAFVYIKGNTISCEFFKTSIRMKQNFRAIFLLVITQFMATMIANGDRFILKALAGGTAVTLYYIASLLGKTMSFMTTPLNSVVIGYLAKFNGQLSLKKIKYLSLISITVIIITVFFCTGASYIIINFLYPKEYEAVKPYFFLANLAQVIYFTTETVLVVLLRFGKKRYQLEINVLFVLCFIIFTVIGTLYYGIWGFAIASIISNLIRYLCALAFLLFLCGDNTLQTNNIQ